MTKPRHDVGEPRACLSDRVLPIDSHISCPSLRPFIHFVSYFASHHAQFKMAPLKVGDKFPEGVKFEYVRILELKLTPRSTT